MKYLSVCSGIEAATVAWHPLGWSPVAFSEIEKFPSRVLAARYPDVPNHGDMTKFQEWPDHAVDILVGGTPCQSFSVAGLRGGLADPRGNLMLSYLGIADRYRPAWLVWENVPGVLSSGGGRDFGTLLRGMAELGYHAAWRVLDAQHVRVDGFGRAVPQRRRRVFVVGYLGDWRRAAAVLFDGESLRGNPPPRREARKGIARHAAESVAGCLAADMGGGNQFAASGQFVAEVAPGLTGSGLGVERPGETRGQDPVVAVALSEVSHCLNAGGMGRQDYETETFVAHFLRADSHQLEYRQDGTANAILTPNGGRAGIGIGAVAYEPPSVGADLYNLTLTGDVAATLAADGGGTSSGPSIMKGWAVRRLTPRECERLQGFPDDYTAIDGAKDGPRYKALGNSMAVNCMRWIGRRIEMVTAQ